jgi:hypothetical protein
MQPKYTYANIERYRNAALKVPTGYEELPKPLSKFNNLTTYGEQSGKPIKKSSDYSHLQRSSYKGSTGINSFNSGMYSTLRKTTILPNSGFYSVF